MVPETGRINWQQKYRTRQKFCSVCESRMWTTQKYGIWSIGQTTYPVECESDMTVPLVNCSGECYLKHRAENTSLQYESYMIVWLVNCTGIWCLKHRTEYISCSMCHIWYFDLWIAQKYDTWNTRQNTYPVACESHVLVWLVNCTGIWYLKHRTNRYPVQCESCARTDSDQYLCGSNCLLPQFEG
jgi:hypothetical protein